MCDAYGLALPLPDDCLSVVWAFARPVHATTRCWSEVAFLACTGCGVPVARVVGDRAYAVDDHRAYLCPLNWCGMDERVVCVACVDDGQGVCACERVFQVFGVADVPLGTWSRVPRVRGLVPTGQC